MERTYCCGAFNSLNKAVSESQKKHVKKSDLLKQLIGVWKVVSVLPVRLLSRPTVRKSSQCSQKPVTITC